MKQFPWKVTRHYRSGCSRAPSITPAYQSITGTSGTSWCATWLSETLAFDRNVYVTVLGGYIAGFASRSGTTIINGTMTSTAGLASFGNVTIK